MSALTIKVYQIEIKYISLFFTDKLTILYLQGVVMNKTQLLNFLYSLTETEKLFKENNTEIYNDKFSKFKNETDNTYVFNYEDHHYKLRNKYPHAEPYLKNTKIEIVKHARYSITPIHAHTYIEMIYVYSGKVESIVNGKKVTLKEGDFCILDENIPHTLLETSQNDIIINFLMSKDYFTTAMLSRLSNDSIILKFLVSSLFENKQSNNYILVNCKNNLNPIIEEMLCEYYSPSMGSQDILDSYVIIIFSKLLRYYQKNNVENNKFEKGAYIGSVLQYIEENHEECTLKSVAEEFNYNPSYLSRLIKEKTGTNFKNLLMELRFNKACILLRNTNLSIEEIINTVGYNNIGFFYEKFHAFYSMSPREYRNTSLVDNPKT